MKITRLVLLTLTLAACGDDGGSPAAIDAAPGPDAPAGPVVSVPCAGATLAETVTAPGFMFVPMTTTISAGQIVQFTMPGSHNAVSDTAGQFRANFGASTCYRFDVAGSYPFHCEPHLFTGTIVVQ